MNGGSPGVSPSLIFIDCRELGKYMGHFYEHLDQLEPIP